MNRRFKLLAWYRGKTLTAMCLNTFLRSNGSHLPQVEVSNRGEINGMCIVIVIWCVPQVHEELDDPFQASWSIIHCKWETC